MKLKTILRRKFEIEIKNTEKREVKREKTSNAIRKENTQENMQIFADFSGRGCST